MSIISQALEKKRLEQVGERATMAYSFDNRIGWKVAISLALLIIITLLSILIYLTISPRTEPKIAPQVEATVIASAPKNKPLKKVTFETKPLPKIAPKVVVKAPPVKALPVPASTLKEDPVTAKQEAKKDQPIDYENTSSDLKKRFELALLLDEADFAKASTDEAITQEDQGDGSDIHEMNTTFQNKVPLMRYDSHMYSSVIKDRWIRINGEKLKEGDFDSTGQFELLEIAPQRSIFRVGKQSFSLESLTDWRGY